jgi:hypothetical protein
MQVPSLAWMWHTRTVTTGVTMLTSACLAWGSLATRSRVSQAAVSTVQQVAQVAQVATSAAGTGIVPFTVGCALVVGALVAGAALAPPTRRGQSTAATQNGSQNLAPQVVAGTNCAAIGASGRLESLNDLFHVFPHLAAKVVGNLDGHSKRQLRSCGRRYRAAVDAGVTKLTITSQDTCRMQLTEAPAHWPGLSSLTISDVTLGRMEIEKVRVMSPRLTDLTLSAVGLTPEYVATLADGNWDRLECLFLE